MNWEKSGYLHHSANDRAFRGNGGICAFAGDDRSFYAVECAASLKKMRFALNNPQIHIAGLRRALKGVSHYLVKHISLVTGVIVWLGLELMGVQFALMWQYWRFLNYVPNIGAVISACRQ